MVPVRKFTNLESKSQRRFRALLEAVACPACPIISGVTTVGRLPPVVLFWGVKMSFNFLGAANYFLTVDLEIFLISSGEVDYIKFAPDGTLLSYIIYFIHMKLMQNKFAINFA